VLVLDHDWPDVIFRNHVDLLAGFAFKSKDFTDDPNDIPLVKGADVQQGYIAWSSCRHWPNSDISKLEKFWLKEGDVILAMDRPWVPSGLKWTWIKKGDPKSLLVQRVARLRGTNGLCTNYLRYLVGSPQFTDYIRPIVTGVNVPHISGDQILNFRFRLPPLPTQRKIAAVLSAYDDLIENNLRRIQILEEMAQNLYREWFVKFRFPGHETARFVDSSLGPIPEGWEVKTIEDTFEILGGGTPSKVVNEYWDDGTINWYSPTDLTASKSMFMEISKNQITEIGLKKSSAKMFPPFSVMMTSRATLGVISINTTEACTNQGFITCIPNERFPLYTLFYWLKENVEYFISLGTGATFKEITKGVFKSIELVVPAKSMVSQLENVVQPIALEILNLQRKNTTLRRTRGLLLPRLVSGEVDVSALEIEVTEG
jgi:type I restriction enzyme S subunit